MVTRYPLIVKIPAGAKPATHQGTTGDTAGVLRFETTHPQIQEFVVLVRYSVTE